MLYKGLATEMKILHGLNNIKLYVGPLRGSLGPGDINNMGPCAGVAAQGQDGDSAPLKYYSAPHLHFCIRNTLWALLEIWALGIYPPPLSIVLTV